MIRRSYSVLLPLVGIVGFVVPHGVIGAPSWDDIAARFKCTQSVQQREQANGTQFIIEYVDAAKAATRPDRLFTITLSRLPQDERRMYPGVSRRRGAAMLFGCAAFLILP